MPKIHITQSGARSIEPPTRGQVDYFDVSGKSPPGFGVRMSATGRRSWMLAYRPNAAKSATRYSIGDADRMPLTVAREKAFALYDQARFVQVAEPTSPAAQRVTFGQLRDRFLREFPKQRTRKGELLRATTVRNYRLALHHPALSPLERLPLSEITGTAVQPALRTLAGAKPVQANRLLATVRALLRWAEDHVEGYTAPRLGDRPGGPERSRDRVLSDSELQCIMLAFDDVGPLRTQGSNEAANLIGCAILRVLMHTGARSAEAAGARWDEINFDTKEWTLPAERSKTHVARTIPLTDPVLAILAAVPRWRVRKLKGPGTEPLPFVFSASGKTAFNPDLSYTRKLVDKAARGHAQRLRITGAFASPWTSHDIRRTVRTGLARLGAAPHIAERILGHTHRDVAATYDRHSYADEMRQALAKWSDHLELLRVTT